MSQASVTRPASPAPFADLAPRGQKRANLCATCEAAQGAAGTPRPLRGVAVRRERLTSVDAETIDAAPPAPHGPRRPVGLGIGVGLPLPPAQPDAPGRHPASAAILRAPAVPDVLAPVAASRAQVAALALGGHRRNVHHCLAHPAAYLREMPFRESCLELARLDGLLRAAEARAAKTVLHDWRVVPRDDAQHVRRTPTALRVSWVQQGAEAGCDMDAFDAERAACYRLGGPAAAAAPEDALPRRAWLDPGWGTAVPVLVLMSLLRRGLPAEAAELLDAGCWLPDKVTEVWQVYGKVPGVGDRKWRVSQSPFGACLGHRGGGASAAWRVLLRAGGRPSVGERLQYSRRFSGQ